MGRALTTVLAAVAADSASRAVLATAGAIAALTDGRSSPCTTAQRAMILPVVGGAVELRRLSGSPAAEIVRAAQVPEVTMVVLGARGDRAGPRPAGTTALEVITALHSPVVVVAAHAQPRPAITRILVALDGTRESAEALEDTLTLARAHALEVVVLHVDSPTTAPAFVDHAPRGERPGSASSCCATCARPMSG